MNRMVTALVTGGVAAAVLAACTADPRPRPGPQQPPPDTDLILRTWTREGHNRKCPWTLTLAHGRILNGYTTHAALFGRYRTDSRALTMYDIDVRSEPGAPAACGRRMADRLGRVARFSVDGMRLALSPEGLGPDVVMITDDPAISTLAPALVGLPESFAERIVLTNDLEFRVTAVDGRDLPFTADFRSERINVKLDAGIVTEAHVG